MITRCKASGQGIATGPNPWCICASAEDCRLHVSDPARIAVKTHQQHANGQDGAS